MRGIKAKLIRKSIQAEPTVWTHIFHHGGKMQVICKGFRSLYQKAKSESQLCQNQKTR
jgi:hypothetical protein